MPATPGSSKTSSGVPESSASSGSSSIGSSSVSGGSSGGCNLTANITQVFTENLLTFDIINSGSTDVEVIDMGFNVATPTFSPSPPFTVAAGTVTSVTMTTVLPNTGGTISIINDCNGTITLFV